MIEKQENDRRTAVPRAASEVFTPEQASRHRRQDILLDEALLETFPASDPVSITWVR